MQSRGMFYVFAKDVYRNACSWGAFTNPWGSPKLSSMGSSKDLLTAEIPLRARIEIMGGKLSNSML